MIEIFKKDYYAFYGENWKIRGVKRLISNRDIRYIYAGRMSTSAKNVFVRMFSALLDTLWLSNDVQKFLSKMLGLDFT